MIVYRTTNLITGMRYIGKDQNNNPNYLGSGKFFKRALTKYGKEHFEKEILETCQTLNELNEAEKKWIEHFNAVNSKKYYNLAIGGDGGDMSIYHTDESRKKMSFPGELNPRYGTQHTEETKQLQKQKAAGRYSLAWFIERNGEEKGTQLYEARNKRLSERPMKGENNPAYRHVDLESLDNAVRTTELGIVKLAKMFNVGETAMYGKLQLLYGTKNLFQIRKTLTNA